MLSYRDSAISGPSEALPRASEAQGEQLRVAIPDLTVPSLLHVLKCFSAFNSNHAQCGVLHHITRPYGTGAHAEAESNVIDSATFPPFNYPRAYWLRCGKDAIPLGDGRAVENSVAP